MKLAKHLPQLMLESQPCLSVSEISHKLLAGFQWNRKYLLWQLCHFSTKRWWESKRYLAARGCLPSLLHDLFICLFIYLWLWHVFTLQVLQQFPQLHKLIFTHLTYTDRSVSFIRSNEFCGGHVDVCQDAKETERPQDRSICACLWFMLQKHKN